MKKLILVLTGVLVIVSIQAQNTVPKDQGQTKKKKVDFYYEAFGAVDLASISGGSSYNSPLFGGQFGVGVTVLGFSEMISLRTELAFSMQGGKYNEGSGSSSTNGHLRLNYLILPIFGRYQTTMGFYADLGVQPGLLLTATDVYSGYYSGSDDVKDQLNGFDFGIVIGIGYKFKNRIGVGIRVVPGVTNIAKNDPGYVYNEHNFVATLRGSYTF